jgi:hypothetical protein
MAEVSTTTEAWIQRVEAWRASGERAETFSRREGYAASTLRWWSSKLKRDLSAPTPPLPASEVRIARVVRETQPAPATSQGYGVMLEVAGVRVGVAADADRATLAMVLDVLGVGR